MFRGFSHGIAHGADREASGKPPEGIGGVSGGTADKAMRNIPTLDRGRKKESLVQDRDNHP